MLRVQELLVKIRRQETPFYSALYGFAKQVRAWRMPIPRSIGSLLYYERMMRRTSLKRLMSVIYYEPMFRSRCTSVGTGLRLENSIQGIPLIIGDLKIFVGNNVAINDITTFCGLKVEDAPRLIIGDNTTISDRVSIFVGKEVRIGSNCIISAALILDNPSHPIDPDLRRINGSIQSEDISEVVIEDDVWLARGSIILEGVRIGRGAIVAAGAVVTRDVEPFNVVAGNPARKVGSVPRSD